MRSPLVAGNWKMNGDIASTNFLLHELYSLKLNQCQVVVCPTFVHLSVAKAHLEGTDIALGAQNVYFENMGAFTGEVSAGMLEDVGCRYVILGHSERRQLFGEMDDFIAKKVLAVQEAGLTPIVCVGETLSERESDLTEQVVAQQIQAVLTLPDFDPSNVVIAYEPIWAIGTGKTATPEQAQAVHAYLRSQLPSEHAEKIQILYGGSVKAANAAELFAMPDIDGGLIGGASLKAEEFSAICQAADNS